MGSLGLLGTKPSVLLMGHCDTLLIVGSSFPYSEFLPKEGQARAVQIDIDGKMLGIRFPTEVNLVGDSAETLRALLPLLKRKEKRGWQEHLRREIEDWKKIIRERALTPGNPINPQFVFAELSPLLPDGCIIAADSGSGTNWFARDLVLRRGMMASLSGTLATMGPAVPYAIAAKFAHPGRPVIACVGDGAMQMNGMNGLITIAKYYREWKDPRLVIMVLDNRDLNQVTWEQRVLSGDPKYAASQELPPVNYAEYAKLLGLGGLRVSTPDQVKTAWETALSADRPFLLDFEVDPNVPPLPPHISFEQAVHLARSLISGDPDSASVIHRAFQGLFPSLSSKVKS